MIPTLALGGLGRSGGGVDPFFPLVSLLLHCDGTDTSTSFPDHGPLGLTVTASGNAQVDTAQSKFGGASALFDGTGDYLSTSHASAFKFPGDFTVELWLHANANPAADVLFDCRSSGGSATGFAIYRAAGVLNVYSGSNQIAGASIATGAWRHIALSRAGSAIKLWLDGAQTGSTWTSSANFSDGPCLLGADNGLASGFLNGWLDDIRITKGVARYTATFTPPAAAFPNS